MIPPVRMTIRVRLTMWYALVVTITLIVLGGIVWLQYSDALRRSLDEVLKAQATATQELVEAVPPGSPDVGALERGVFLVVFDTSGRVSYASPGCADVRSSERGVLHPRCRHGGAGRAVRRCGQQRQDGRGRKFGRGHRSEP